MAEKLIPPFPEIPSSLRNAAREARLVPFVGAGVSALGGAPLWDDFATSVLKFVETDAKLGPDLCNLLKSQPHRVKLAIAEQLKVRHGIEIDYRKILAPKPEKEGIAQRAYAALASLGTKFITTNYDEWLDRDLGQPSASIKPSDGNVIATVRRKTVIDDPSEISIEHLVGVQDTVLHLHGSVKRPEKMVLTMRDYLELYAGHELSTEPDRNLENPFITFLKKLFLTRSVLFVGYGLAELEMLEQILRKAVPAKEPRELKHYILQGFPNREAPLVAWLGEYYSQFGVELLPFSIETNGWGQLLEVIKYLGTELKTGHRPILGQREDMESWLLEPTPSTEREFARLMAEDPEKEEWGFEILSDCQDRRRWFNQLKDAGLFQPSRNPGPVSSHAGGFEIPYWRPLGFLLACAKSAPDLAKDVRQVVREVSRHDVTDGKPIDNYRTYRAFAEILGVVPLDQIQEEDLSLIPLWLRTRFGRNEVVRAIDGGLIEKLLASNASVDWQSAAVVLRHCTELQMPEEDEARPARRRSWRMAADEEAVAELLQHHSGQLGAKVGRESAEVLLDRIRTVFTEDRTWQMRPAVEDHVQNRPGQGVPDVLVEGARDVLVAWAKASPKMAGPYVRQLLSDRSQMVRRIAIFLMNECRELLGELPVEVVPSLLAHVDHLHELYGLLQEHYQSFELGMKKAALEAIRSMRRPDFPEDDRFLKDIQRTWLSAIVSEGGTVEPEFGEWYAQLSATADARPMPEHPDFFVWHETRVGPGPSPYASKDLIEFARRGSLIDELNDFEEARGWNEPTVEALVQALENAVLLQLETFVPILTTFTRAKPEYQYGVINGFKRAWELKKSDGAWHEIWPSLVDLFEMIACSPNFWDAPPADHRPLSPNVQWIRELIAEFFRCGTRTDDPFSCPTDLLPRVWNVLADLLRRAKSMAAPGEDPQNRAINSEKGRMLEALFSYALRLAREAHARSTDHWAVWKDLEPIFERELELCQDANFEFSVLAAENISQLYYLDPAWLGRSVSRIFSSDHPRNFQCAVAGLAYASLNLPVYRLLVDNGVFDGAVRAAPNDEHTRVQLLEWIAVGYLWGENYFAERTLPYLFEAQRGGDIRHLTHYFWRVSKNEQPSREQVERILQFWERSVTWAADNQPDQQQTLGSLGRLASYASGTDKDFALLCKTAPFVHLDHGDWFLIEELNRLVENHSMNVMEVCERFLAHHTPPMDYDGGILALVTSLLDRLPAQTERLSQIVDKLEKLPGMRNLWKRLK